MIHLRALRKKKPGFTQRATGLVREKGKKQEGAANRRDKD